jgi:hypothetical protein
LSWRDDFKSRNHADHLNLLISGDDHSVPDAFSSKVIAAYRPRSLKATHPPGGLNLGTKVKNMIWHQNCCIRDPFGTVGGGRRPDRDGGRPYTYKERIVVDKLLS